MKYTGIITAVLLLTINLVVNSQQLAGTPDKWNYLIGTWAGDGKGQPGAGTGTFSFQSDLDGKIIVRKNHTTFPETAGSKAMVHDDLLIVYRESDGAPQQAIYFDNEGHIIKYRVTFTENAIVLTSDTSENTPRFRLSYEMIDNETVNVIFGIATPQKPEEFRQYLAGKAFKIK